MNSQEFIRNTEILFGIDLNNQLFSKQRINATLRLYMAMHGIYSIDKFFGYFSDIESGKDHNVIYFRYSSGIYLRYKWEYDALNRFKLYRIVRGLPIYIECFDSAYDLHLSAFVDFIVHIWENK